MSELSKNFIIPERCNISYDENTGLFDLKTIDYKIDQKFLKTNDIKIFNKKNIPCYCGINSHYQFQIDNYYYTFGGNSSGTHGGCHFWPLVENKKGGTFNNNLLRYDLKNDVWKNFGNIEHISKRGLGTGFVYKKKMYIIGGYAWEYMDDEYLKNYAKKYGKWPKKSGMWHSNDMWEISVINNTVKTKKIQIDFFTNRSMNAIVYKNKVFITGGAFGKVQLNYMKINVLLNFLKNKKCRDIVNKLGDQFFSGQILFFIDMENIEKGLQVECLIPGIPCSSSNLIIHNNFLYLFGDYSYINTSNCLWRPGEKNRASCTNNWKYHLVTKKWTRIKNTPMKGYGGYSISKISKKYAIILGGSRYFLHTSIDNKKDTNDKKEFKSTEEVLKFDKDKYGSYNILDNSEFKPYFKYGTICNTYSHFNEIDQKTVTSIDKIKSYDYFQHYFSDIIMFYNFDEDKYYLSNHHLPYNIALPMKKHPIFENNIFIIGGETNDILFNKKCHYTNNNLVIKIECDMIKEDEINIIH
jgi:hypothetical protein